MTKTQKSLSTRDKIGIAVLSPVILFGIGLSFTRAYRFYDALKNGAENVFVSTHTFTIVTISIYALMLACICTYGFVTKQAPADKNTPKTAGQKVAYGCLVYGTVIFVSLALFSPFLTKIIAQQYGYAPCLREQNYAAGSGGYGYVIYSKTKTACGRLRATGETPLKLEGHLNPSPPAKAEDTAPETIDSVP